MKKEDLIIKWLNNQQLTKQESEAFEQLDVFDSYVKISRAATKFKAPDYKSEEAILTLKDKLVPKNQKRATIISYPKVLMRIAAILVLGIGLYFSFVKEYNTRIQTLASENTSIELPDASVVEMNALSSLSYNKSDWKNNRKITLDGEAFFKVAKGQKFDVYTTRGVISVLGTKFNVKQRDNYLKVTCYEGVVSVSYNDVIKYLKEGDLIEMSADKIVEGSLKEQEKPQWLTNRSVFYSTPYEKVLQELEWQYGLPITTKNIDKSILFTGNFVHFDIETALKSITIPMQLKYSITNKNITLYKE